MIAAPTACPECDQGKHGNCTGDAWDDDLDQPTVCDCWQQGHDGAHWPACPVCGDRVAAGEFDEHLAEDHADLTPPTVRQRPGGYYDPEGEDADRESDRLDLINESRLP